MIDCVIKIFLVPLYKICNTRTRRERKNIIRTKMIY